VVFFDKLQGLTPIARFAYDLDPGELFEDHPHSSAHERVIID
jgi:hypothetical protein